jgi:outer membrane protein insertion porin family
MIATRFFACKNIVYLLAVAILFYTSACSVVPRHYPAQQPFVFNYSVTVTGPFTPAEKEALEDRLGRQLDDSIKVRTVRKFLYRGINRPVINNPPLYDVANVEKSKLYMRALLTSLGYFKDTITHRLQMDTVRDEYRTTVHFIVAPGKQVIIDSLSYQLSQPALQQLAMENKDTSFVKKGGVFAKANVSAELDRLTNLYRNNGYLRFGREDLYGLWDTLDVSLLRPALDPFEQAELLAKLRQRRLRPTANIEFRLKAPPDSLKYAKYFVGDVIIFPDKEVLDTANIPGITVTDGVVVKSYHGMFKEKIFTDNLYLRKGELYNQQNYFSTISRLNALGSWRIVNLSPRYREGKDTADFIIQMVPEKKYAFTTNFEGSSNNNSISGNFVGVGFNANVQNRNFGRAANQANTFLRFGIELGKNLIDNKRNILQTFQLSAGHNISFPRPVLFPKRLIHSAAMRNSFKTLLGISGAITNRRQLFFYNTGNLFFGWEFQTFKPKPITHSLRLFNIEYSDLIKQPIFDSIFKKNPSFARIFTDGLISSFIYSGKKIIEKGNHLTVYKLGVENAGLLPGLISKNNFLDTNLYRFSKIDLEYIKKINFKKEGSAIAYRFFAGIGYEWNSTANKELRYNLPFIRQYFAGGPSSMRAWALRKLGPGSLVQNFDTTGIPDRYGDLQLEANIEYRFKAFKLFGIPVNGALFTDMGNIWYIKQLDDGSRPDETIFRFKNIARDVAIGAGVGFRFDFSFLIIRLDVSHKIKDPSPTVTRQYLQNKFFGYVEKDFWRGTQFQLGISYPFIL